MGGKIPIIFDSGVRNGSDVVKALALGADFVCIGRPYVCGLALQGKEGVRHVIKSILGELDLTVHLNGLSGVQREHLNTKIMRKLY